MFALFFLVFCIFLLIFIKTTTKPHNYPPGPIWLPFLGTQLQVGKLRKSLGGLHLAFSHLSKKYNSPIIGVKLGKQHFIVVSTHELIREVLLRDEFLARPRDFFLKMRCLGRVNTGITGADGAVWTANRTFAVQHLKRLGFGGHDMQHMVQKELGMLTEKLRTDGEGVHANSMLAPSVLNVLWQLVAGGVMHKEGVHLEDLLEMFQRRGKLFDPTGGWLNRYPWLRFIAPEYSGYNLIQQINTKLKDVIETTIKEHQDTWTEGRNDDLIYAYISEIKKDESHPVYSYDELVIICLDFFIAGTQITSLTLEILFYFMLHYPEVQKKVQEEIDVKVGKGRSVLASDLTKLPYTKAVITESQRCSPVVSLNGPRRALEDTTLGGYFVPKGSTVLMNYYHFFHNEKLWEQSESFKPERFIDENGKYQAPDVNFYFGLGKRRCPGEVLARQFVFLFFAETMKNFSVAFPSNYNPKKQTFEDGITLSPANFKADFVQR